MTRLMARVYPCIFGLAALAASAAACAQGYPAKPVRVIVPFVPGLVLDVSARLIAEKMSVTLGKPVVVENRPGAGGRLGSELAARAAPDGYTILYTSAGTQIGSAFLVKDLGFDPVKDFAPISAAVSTVDCILINPSLPVNSLQELVEYAKRNPGKLAYGSNGIGSSFHMAGELIKQVAGIDMLHVPLQGATDQLNALIGGHIQVAFNSANTGRTQLAAGKVKVLAVLRETRYPGLPNVPTVTEVLPGYPPLPSWFGYLGPAGMPAPTVARLNAEIVRSLNTPELKAKFDDMGVLVIGNSPEEFASLMRATFENYGKAVKAANLQPQ